MRLQVRADEVQEGDVFVLRMGGRARRERKFPIHAVFRTTDGQIGMMIGSDEIEQVVFAQERPDKRLWIERED